MSTQTEIARLQAKVARLQRKLEKAQAGWDEMKVSEHIARQGLSEIKADLKQYRLGLDESRDIAIDILTALSSAKKHAAKIVTRELRS